MVPLIVFVAVFAGLRLAAARGLGISRPCSARFALASVFMVAGSAHFVTPSAFVEMIPEWLPAREAAVYATGALELALALALATRLSILQPRWVGGVAMLLLGALFPANVYAALHSLGPGAAYGAHYLWFRTPVQALLLAAAWYATYSRAANSVFKHAGARSA